MTSPFQVPTAQQPLLGNTGSASSGTITTAQPPQQATQVNQPVAGPANATPSAGATAGNTLVAGGAPPATQAGTAPTHAPVGQPATTQPAVAGTPHTTRLAPLGSRGVTAFVVYSALTAANIPFPLAQPSASGAALGSAPGAAAEPAPRAAVGMNARGPLQIHSLDHKYYRRLRDAGLLSTLPAQPQPAAPDLNAHNFPPLPSGASTAPALHASVAQRSYAQVVRGE